MNEDHSTKLPLTPMDAGLLRQIAAKIDDDCINTADGLVLRSIAKSLDELLEWCEGARSAEEVEEIMFRDATVQSQDDGDPNAKLCEHCSHWYDSSNGPCPDCFGKPGLVGRDPLQEEWKPGTPVQAQPQDVERYCNECGSSLHHTDGNCTFDPKHTPQAKGPAPTLEILRCPNCSNPVEFSFPKRKVEATNEMANRFARSYFAGAGTQSVGGVVLKDLKVALEAAING